MKKVKIKARAKINLTLDVLGVTGNYHDIKSLVTSIDLYDQIVIRKRKDTKITLKCKGIPIDCEMTNNNAYKAAKLFIKTFKTSGVDIVINKKIPIGAGLGGSSADIAGVLNGMKELFELDGDLLPLANSLGSDSGYMLTGGYAIITGRGENIANMGVHKTLYLLIVSEEKAISAKASYKAFDKIGKIFDQCTLEAEKALEENDFNKFTSLIKNDLYHGSKEIVSEIQANLLALKKAGAPAAVMTGSGSAVYGVFENKKQRDISYKKLLPLYGNKLIKAQTE